MNQAERLNWQKRVEFYGKKWQDYKIKFLDRHPCQATIRRWAKECNEMLERSEAMIIEFVPHPALSEAIFGLRNEGGEFRAFCYKLKTGYGVDIIVRGKPRNGAQFNEVEKARAWAKTQLADLVEWTI